MRNLVIGNTSQLAHYFPEDYVKISSRNIPDEVFTEKWENIYVCFAEQRTFLDDTDVFFDINCAYTMRVVDGLKYDRLYFYSTILLWSALNKFDVYTPFKYHETPYMESKEEITRYIMGKTNTTVLFPCNFNSIYRKDGSLFGKVFDSIKNRKQITLGDTNFTKELTHPRRVVEESFGTEHKIIHGVKVNVNEVIRELYSRSGLIYEDYVTEVNQGREELIEAMLSD